jgi:hypothetical protein
MSPPLIKDLKSFPKTVYLSDILTTPPVDALKDTPSDTTLSTPENEKESGNLTLTHMEFK